METSNPEKSSRNYYLLSFLLFLIVVVGLVFYLRPLWDDVNSLSLGRDDMLSQKTALQDKLVSLQEVQQTLNQSTEVTKETSLASIPERLEEDKLIADVVKISRDNDVSMNGISFGIPVNSQSGEIAKASINLNLTGTEDQLNGFLRGIEANARKIVVKSITVQLASETTQTTTQQQLANFNLSMETYYQGVI